jgi:carbon-monoxide dehydrogenase large subunit
LPAVVDPVAALADGAPLVHAGQATNRAFTWTFSGGDYAAARRRAKVVVSRRFVQQRVMPTAMEPRAVLAEPFPATGEFTLWTSTQVPHFVRLLMSSVCGIGEQKLRVIAPDVGGGFGGKLNVYAEEAIALAVARRLGRPVKWTATRSEDYQATTHGRDMIQDVEIAAARDGRVLGLKVDLTSDLGAYLQLLTPAVPLLGRYVYPGIYKFDAHEFTCQGVFTTKTPTDSYRGAGRPEATFAVERIMDELAAELGLDPLELRQRNWISHDEFPYTTVTGLTYDSGNYEAATARALEMMLLNEEVSAAEAARWGFVNRVVPRDKLMEETLAYAADVAENDPFDMRTTKLAINQALDAQGFTSHIMSSHSTYITRRLGSMDPGYTVANPRDTGKKRMPMVQVALDRYKRDQERGKK